MANNIQIGDRFKLTGRFLRSTGQAVGGEGPKVWTRVDCDCGLCRSGRFVCSDEPRYDGQGMRHLNVANVYKYGSTGAKEREAK